ncbi:unnamed protein product [Adineta steineri]|uniref:Uncharacterized protein n=1 Tax=Adineta steineri TaxID=433720 RepID=A0A819XI73_9BILA|nr:unnamed protein product [Adineta steineri]CAF4142502.1 unnamed protein product [Adineta steineri]
MLRHCQRNSDLIKATIKDQLCLCEDFDNYLEQQVKETITSIEQQTMLYQIAANSNNIIDFYSIETDDTEICSAAQLINNGLALLKFMNQKIKHENERQLTNIKREEDELPFYFLFISRLSLEYEIDIRKTEAELIKVNMTTQSSLLEKFINFMKQTLHVNNALIRQQTRLYELASKSETKADFFIDKADHIETFSCQQLINLGIQKIKYLNLENAQETEHLESKLTELLRITDRNSPS